MSVKQEAKQEGNRKLKRLLESDKAIRRAAKKFWRESRRDSEALPFYYLLLLSTRLRIFSKRLIGLVNQILYIGKLRESEARGSSRVQKALRKFGQDPLIQSHLSNVQDPEEDLNLEDNSNLLEEIEDRILRDAALSVAWISSSDTAWQSALAGVSMPPFEPSDTREEAVRQITSEARKTDFWDSLVDLELVNEKTDAFPISPVAKLFARHLRVHLRKLQETHKERAISEREKFIRHAERSEQELNKKGTELILKMLDRHNTKVLSGLHDEFSLESRSLTKLLATDFGSKAALDIGIDAKQEIKAALRENMESLLLSLGCFIDVKEALNNTGNPKSARRTIAYETDRIATRKRAEHLETAYQTLKANPELRNSPRTKWKSKLDENGGSVKSVVRLAKKCFEVDQKRDLPDQYRGFEKGGFANLVEDLLHGNWEN